MTANLAPALAALGFPKLERTDRRTFFFALTLYALVILPILIADRYHVDDWGRAVLGYSDWGKDGRPLTDVLMEFLALRRPLVDFSPLCQIAAIACLSCISVLAARKFRINNPFVAACATLPLGANPFFLANLTVKFDSLPHALSVVFALLPTLQREEAGKRQSLPLLIGCASLLGSLCLYQPSLNAFLIFAILEYIFLQMKSAPPRELLVLIVTRVGQLFIAACLYKLIVLFTVHGYGAEHSSFITDPRSFGIIWRNFVDCWATVFQSLWKLKLSLLLPIAISLAVSVAIGLRYRRTFARGNLLMGFVSNVIPFVTPAALVLATFGFLILLASLPEHIHIFIGFGALLSGSLILIIAVVSELRISPTGQGVLLAFPTYVMIAFAAIYGNAAKMQNEYEKHVAGRLSDDLKEIIAAQPVDRLILEGTIGHAPIVVQAIKRKFHLLDLLVDVDLQGDPDGFGFPNTVLRYYGVTLEREPSDSKRADILAISSASKPVKANVYYRVYVVDRYIVVRLLSPPQ